MTRANLRVHLAHRGQAVAGVEGWRIAVGYDQKFFEDYADDLSRDPVRGAHDAMFDAFDALTGHLVDGPHPCIDVLDLGCGSCEFHRYGDFHNRYHGIDLYHAEPGMPAVLGDYTAPGLSCPFPPTAFVSLFSTELWLPPGSRYSFYEGLFDRFPTLRHGMVSGFYYDDGRRDMGSVLEVRGFETSQSIEHPRDVMSGVFREFRCYQRVPSALFGPDVVEVWKFFSRA